MVTVRVCSNLKTSWKSVVFTNKVGTNSRDFAGILNETINPLVLVEYEMIKVNSTLRTSLPLYHLISNAHSWNNCYIYQTRGSVLLQRAVELKVWIEGEYGFWVRLGKVYLKPALCAQAWRQRYKVPTVCRGTSGENRGRIETPTLLSRLEKPILIWKNCTDKLLFVYDLPNF